MATKVIDISSYQKNVDFKKVKAAGISGVIIRAGYTGYGSAHTMCKDDLFESHYKNAKAAGLHVGAYYYSGALTEAFAVKEAQYFLTLLKGKQLDLPVYMDVEESHSTTNMPGLGKTKLTAVVYKWCETVEKASSTSPTDKVFRAGRSEWEISISHLVVNSEPFDGLLKVGNTYTLSVVIESTRKTGTAICVAADLGGSVGNLATGSVKFQGSGPLE